MSIIANISGAEKVTIPTCSLLPKTGFPAPAKISGKVKRGTAAGDAYRQNAKAKADMVAKLKAMDDLFTRAEGERLELCGKDFITTMSNKCGKTVDTYPANKCGLAYCPDCNVRRRNRELKSVKPKFEKALRDNPALRPYFLTLTLKDRMTQRTANKYLKKQFEKLRDRKVWTVVKGGCYSIEFTVVFDGWNAHLHAVILSEQIPSQNEIQKAWSKLTCGSYRVDIRPIAVDELDTVLGYMFKPADLSQMTREQVLEMVDAPAIRTVETFGIVRKAKVTVTENISETPKPKVGDACDCGDPECRIVQRVLTRDELITLLDYKTPFTFPARSKVRYVH